MCGVQSSTYRQPGVYRHLPRTTVPTTFNNTVLIYVTTQYHDPQDQNIYHQITLLIHVV